MKIKPEHYSTLETAITTAMQQFPQLNHEAYIAQGLTSRRFRWDCLWASKRFLPQHYLVDVLGYMDDSHFDTALRRITNTR